MALSFSSFVITLFIPQASTIDLKRVYVSTYAVENFGVHHIQKVKKTQGL